MKRKKSDIISVKLHILRRASSQASPYWQTILYETTDSGETVATALTRINQRIAEGGSPITDLEGNPVSTIRWQCSCLQKKCGACAMVIGGTPALACDTFLRDHKKDIYLEPLRKFPVIADLIVDRSILYENLKELTLWFSQATGFSEKKLGIAYDASRCLQCGCCLEVCPNFCPGGPFYGAAAFVPTTRLLSSLAAEDKARIKEYYKRHIYDECGKSLACAKVCPAGIDTEGMLIRANAILYPWGLL